MEKLKTPSYTTVSEYVRYLCKQNHKSLTRVCDELDIKYRTIAGNYKSSRIGFDKLYRIIKYLNGDPELALSLPVKKPS